MEYGVGFCGKCGKQAGTAPPPKPRRFCQSCGVELADGIQFCQGCGNKAPGAGFSLPSNVNLDSAKNFAVGLNIHLQRLALMAASVLGLLGCLMPWFGVNIMGFRITVNAFRAKGAGESGFHLLGTIVFVLFAASLVLCLFHGNRAAPAGQLKFAFAGCGGLALLIGITRFFSEEYEAISMFGGGARLGLILVILMSAALGAIPFIKQLER
jgi:hypothetical protein